MISPRELFTKEFGKTWPDVVDSRQFQMAAVQAFAQMQVDLGRAPDMATAASQAWEMAGAKRFLHILMEMADPPAKPGLPTGKTLNHRA